MLVANSVYEACKYWEIFTNNGFTKCAVVTSFEPNSTSVRTATSDLTREGEEEYKKSIYERMLNGQKLSVVEKADKELPNIDEDADENRDTVSIYNLLKENLDMWVSEEEGEQ